MVNYLVIMVVEQHEIGSTSNDEPKSKSKARGADFRKAHTAVFKAKVIHCEPGVYQYHIADKFGINQSQVSKWRKIIS